MGKDVEVRLDERVTVSKAKPGTREQALAPNAYVAMNGRVFTWDNVKKDKAGGVFEPSR